MTPRKGLQILSRWPLLACLATAALLAGCAAPKSMVNEEPLPFDEAIAGATDALVAQTLKLPAFMGKLGKRTVVLDPTLDSSSGQQTVGTQYLDKQLAERIGRASEQFEVLPFEASNLAKAQMLLTGTLTRTQAAYRLDLALVDIKSGSVSAQSAAMVRAKGVDMRPLAYYRDSPILVKDKVVDGYVRTSATAPGQQADRNYLDRIASATVVNDATRLYNSARYRDALGQYRSALAMPAGEQIRVLNGIYLSTAKLGETAAAEEAFARLVAFGIANNNLGVKFLFNPGSTDFWSDPKVSGPYPMWVKQIALEADSARVCMEIVGHTSKTGTEAVNDSLSLRRATYIRQRLSKESPDLAKRSKVQGMGAREPIVGTGTDDVVDAPDRRVEFTIVGCPA